VADPYRGLTPRGRHQRHVSRRRGITEQPANSNFDDRRYGIRTAQRHTAGGGTWLDRTPWCGEWQFYALETARVPNISYRLASVALIEDDARNGRGPFRKWVAPNGWQQVLRGDLVVLFGRGVHVEGVRTFIKIAGVRYVVTDGGNTSSGPGGSQSNGGGAYRRVRPLTDVHGFAIVSYRPRRGAHTIDRAAMRLEAARARLQLTAPAPAVTSMHERAGRGSDWLLLDQLQQRAKHTPLGGHEGALRAELAAALHHRPGSNR
jgi:hypothetical protein